MTDQTKGEQTPSRDCTYRTSGGLCGTEATVELELYGAVVWLCHPHAKTVERRAAHEELEEGEQPADGPDKDRLPNRGRLYDIPKDVPGTVE